MSSSKVLDLINQEDIRQKNTLMMIPSENYTYPEVRRAVGSVLMHKYSEGYPGKRYYQGNKFVDEIEDLAIDRAKALFGVPHANVQAYSGSPANSAVFMALLDPGDKILGLKLSAGGHLTHGHPKITFSGKFFTPIHYELDKEGVIDYKALDKLAKTHKPKLIIAGITAYSRMLEWEKFANIADSVGAYLLADISHIAGLVAAGVHPSPAKYAHVISTTTHKTLRGPRGALVMATKKGLDKDPDLGKLIDRAVFPGLQGGPHNNQTAGIAITLAKANSAEFRKYAKDTVKNAKVLSEQLASFGFEIVSGKTENHMFLIDLRNKNVSGREYAVALERAGIIVNYNAIPNDPNPPRNPSGIRVGTPALSARGMKGMEMKLIARLFNEVVININDSVKLKKISLQAKALCDKFPVEL
ncbi:serine hydroxymethyltransferase [Candidatus Microgenomates bacterium]|nr:MAG: serine hydroxymethyltransferase [Candidatus Microgenomates bacterium]